jgi:hypothetical protein
VNRNTPSAERSRPRTSEEWTWGRRTYWAGFERMRPSVAVRLERAAAVAGKERGRS